MSYINVNVVAPGEANAPDTGILTHTSNIITGGSNTFYIGMGVITAIALIVILPIIFARKGLFKKPVSGFSVFSKKKLLPKILFLALFSFGITFSVLDIAKHSASGTNATGSTASDDVLTITTEDLEIDIELYDEPVYKSGQTTVTVATGTEGGYTLSAYASAADLVNEKNSEGKISGLTASGLTTLTDNTWGFSLTAPESKDSPTWQSLPTTAQDAFVIKSTTAATPANDQTTVYYGTYVTPDLPTGTYAGTINYVAVANVIEKTINSLEYMQDFNTLSDEDRESVLASMMEDEQYQLKDRRDEKIYYISKLRDGNVWMTQNLDHDIDSTRIYTPDDTDIPANWTPSTSTHATGVTTWNNSASAPESYDPGDLYWNGTTHDPGDLYWNGTTQDGSGDFADYITTTGNSHYHLGNYYNWTAAVAMNDSGSYTSFGALVDQSICPAGWTLPRAGYGDDTFYALVNEYDTWDSSSYTLQNETELWTSPTYFSLSGSWYGSFEYVGIGGVFWSPLVCDSDGAYVMHLVSRGDVYPGIYADNRNNGDSVRCIARPVASAVSYTEP